MPDGCAIIAKAMVIRSDQLGTFDEDARTRANRHLAAYARERFPERFFNTTDEVLLRIVEEIRHRAAAEGFEQEDHIASFLDLTVMYGGDFPRSAWAEPILTNKGLDAEHKMQSLAMRVEESGIKL